MVGRDLQLFENLEVQNPKGAGGVPHFRLDVDQDNGKGATPSGTPEKNSPSKKKARGGKMSPVTGDTRASQDDPRGMGTSLPADSEDEGGKV